MFYLKHKNEEVEMRVYYTGENFYTECAVCGTEIQIDLDEFSRTEDIDFLSTKVFCERCGGCGHS